MATAAGRPGRLAYDPNRTNVRPKSEAHRGPAAGRRPGGRCRVGSRLAVRVGDGRGRPVDDHGLARWLASVAPSSTSDSEVSVALVSDAFMRTLNRRFRGRREVTDVLSFATEDRPALRRGVSRHSNRPRHPHALGDIVIAAGVASRQARRLGHPYATELRVLALHGLLHLLGYDHDTDSGEMARAERRLRRRGGLTGGLVERVTQA